MTRPVSLVLPLVFICTGDGNPSTAGSSPSVSSGRRCVASHFSVGTVASSPSSGKTSESNTFLTTPSEGTSTPRKRLQAPHTSNYFSVAPVCLPRCARFQDTVFLVPDCLPGVPTSSLPAPTPSSRPPSRPGLRHTSLRHQWGLVALRRLPKIQPSLPSPLY